MGRQGTKSLGETGEESGVSVSMYKGIYIEDDDNNILVIKTLFEQEGLEVVALPELPESREDIYALILEHRADFLLIDHELNKKVNYNGYEALQAIRDQDSTLYAVLLTNYKVEDFKKEFGIYDMEVYKGDLYLDDKLREICEKIKRACDRAHDAESLACAKESRKYAEERLEILRQIQMQITKKE